jgi:threonine/homoserine/homoserine lactone efflux protein
MLVSFLVGLATGFGMAVPPGPINFAIFEKSINGQKHIAYRLLGGALAGDTVYCLLAVVYQLSSEWLRIVKLAFSGLGGAFLIGLGVFYMFFKKPPCILEAPEEIEEAHHGHFLTGFLFALSNPFFIVALIAVTELYYSLSILQPDIVMNILFVIGFQGGAFLWLSGMGKIASLNQRHFTKSRTVIQRMCGAAYVGFGVYMLAKFLKLVWL